MGEWETAGMDARRAMGDLARALPDGAEICGVDFETRGGKPVVTVRTTTPTVIVGRRGAVAEQLRTVLAASLGPDVRLDIAEQRDRLAG